jgi:Cu/Ag efflux pump CusA
MTRWIIDSSLRLRLLVVVVAAGVMAFGIVQLRDAPVDVLPEFTPPYVEIQTEALGLSADEVEQLITVPLEADLLNGVAGVDTIRSESVPGLSSVVMVFRPGTDVYKGRALVQERLTQAHALPNVSKPPLMLNPTSSSSRVLMIGLSDGARKLTPIEKGILARWTIRPRLLGVQGVANVAIWGQREQQLQVQVDPRRLREKHVTLEQIIATTGNAQLVSPLTFLEASTPGTGGFIETPTQRLQVRHVFDRLSTPAALAEVPVEDSPAKLRLGDVSTIVEDHQPLIGDAVVDGGDGLMLVVEKLPGANTLDVTRGVEKALDDLRPGLAGMRTDTNVFRPATFVRDAIGNLTLAIVIAAVLLALALAAFLMRWRTVLTGLVAVSLSLVAGALVVDLLGATMNAISFAGLAAAVAIVVGDAVAGAESVARRLRDEHEHGGQASPHSLVLEASMALRRPLTYAVVIALLAVLPVVVMKGRPGAFFDPLVVSYVAAVLASTLVALTVTPALSLLLASRAPHAGGVEPALMRRLGALYATALARVVVRPRAALLAAGGCGVVALAALALLGTSVVPSFKDRDLLVHLDAKPGTAQPVMTRVAGEATRRLKAIPGVRDVGAHVGRAVTGDQVVDVNSSELWVNVDSGADYDKTVAAVRRTVAGLDGLQRTVVPYSQQRIRDVGTLVNGGETGKDGALSALTGTRKPLVVRVFGEDLATLRTIAQKVRGLVSGVDGVVGARIDQPTEEPTIEIETNLDAARRHGIKPGDVRRADAVLLQGIQVGSIFGKQKVFDVVVQGVPSTRKSVASVRDLLIDGPNGTSVRLGDVATVRVRQAPNVIRRDAVSRRIDVVAGIRGRGEAAVRKDVDALLAATPLPLEYHAELLTDSTSREIGATAIIATAIAVLVAMFLLLQATLRSWRVAALTFLTLPAALVGGLLAALLADGTTLSLGALLGLLGTFAIAVRGAIVLVSHIQRLEDDEGLQPGGALVQRGAREQFGPVVTAALATAAFLLPFVVLGSRVGLEIVHPMAAVMLGGLVTATLMSLFVLPALYAGFGGRADRDPTEDLLHRWAGVEPAPAAPAPAVGAIVINPDVLPEPARERILPRRRSDDAEAAPEPPTRAS